MTVRMPAGTPAKGLPVHAARLRLVFCFATVVVLLAGCSPEEPVVVERVPKEDIGPAPVVRPVARTDRMLAAIIPHGETAIFFKTTGPAQVVAGLKDGFLQTVRSVNFEGDQPQWTLPEGWTQETGDGGELLATIAIPAEPPLSMTVTSLPLRGDDVEYRLMNVNRWRRQMGLRDMAADQLHAGGDLNEETVAVPLEDGTKATVVNIAGQFASGGMTPPFMSQSGSARPSASMPANAETDGPAYDVPEGWKELGAEGISVASFMAGDVRTTVIPLSASNEVAANVNRWREQVGLPKIDESQVDETLESITLGDGQDGKYVELVGPESEKQQAILGVIAYRDDRAWFVKMTGDSKDVLDERSNFQSFVNSLRFSQGGQ